MYFWNSYPFIRLSVCLILGVVAFEANPSLWIKSDLLIGCSSLVLILTLLLSRKVGFYTMRHVNGAIAIWIMFFFGGELTKRKYHDYSASHYKNVSEKTKGFSGTIISAATERTNHFRYDFQLIELMTDQGVMKSSGTIHLYIRKDSIRDFTYNYGDLLLISGSYYELTPPDNPHEFDYKKYLSRKGLYAHCFTQADRIQLVGYTPSNFLLKYAIRAQLRAAEIIDAHVEQPKENAIAKALLLGIKDHLDNDLKKSYSAAGAMHVLAVSGLHVGIVYLFLQSVFGRLRRTRSGAKLFGVLSILTIWIYALITGLSPSVLRAATMFSVVALSEIAAKKGNVYNTLGVAAFLLLLFDPYLIYSVGFQLSFTAVFGIVYLQPKIYRLVDFDFWLLDKIWAITCVSIAAQIATFPLTALYFHQFPTYFLISNLVVIPAATLMLISGILMLLLDPISHQLGAFFGYLLSKVIWAVNWSVSIVEDLPRSLIEWIYLDQVGAFLIYSMLLTFIWGLHHRSFKTLMVFTAITTSYIGWNLQTHLRQQKARNIWLYEIKNQTAIDIISGHQAQLYVDTVKVGDLSLLSYQINPNRLANGLRPISESIQSFASAKAFIEKQPFIVGSLDGTRIIIVDSTTFHLSFQQVIETDLLVIENEAIKNIKWLQDHFQFEHLILGNKNSPFFIRKMKKQAEEVGLSVHSLSVDGAFNVELLQETTKFISEKK